LGYVEFVFNCELLKMVIINKFKENKGYMNRSKKKRIENENERNSLLKLYRRRDIIVCLVFLIICLVCPFYKQHLPPIVTMLINNPKKGFPYAAIVVIVDILLYIWIRIDTTKRFK
jgi:hypothetical protein